MTAIFDRSKKYSLAEYLATEIDSNEKLEYYNGKLHAMAGGTIPHNRICRNILAGLHFALSEKFEAFGSDQKVFLSKYNFYVYPDAVVVAGTPLQTEKAANAIINPVLIIEVLSPSTAKYDKKDKFIQYQSLNSFTEYALILQEVPEVQTRFREEPDLWRSIEFSGLNSTLVLRSVGLRIDMKRIYKGVKFV